MHCGHILQATTTPIAPPPLSNPTPFVRTSSIAFVQQKSVHPSTRSPITRHVALRPLHSSSFQRLHMATSSDFTVELLPDKETWSVVHLPSGVQMLRLARVEYETVAIEDARDGEGQKTSLCVAAKPVGGEDAVRMPIRFPDAAPLGSEHDLVLRVELLGSHDTVIMYSSGNETVGAFKSRLSARCGIPPCEQALWVGRTRIDNDRTPLRYTPLASHAAYVRVGRSGKLRIGVRGPSGVTRVMVFPSTIVRDLKELVASRLNILPERQILVFAGRQLPNEATVRECGVFAGSEIEVMTRASVHEGDFPHATIAHDRYIGEDTSSEHLLDTVDGMLSTVTTLVKQQCQLQSTVSTLLGSCAGSLTPHTDSRRAFAPQQPASVPLRPASASPRPGGRAASVHSMSDMLAQSRRLRSAAAAEAESALHMASPPGFPTTTPNQVHGHRSGMHCSRPKSLDSRKNHASADLLRHLSREAKDMSEDVGSMAGSLSRMERTRQAYHALRQEITLEVMSFFLHSHSPLTPSPHHHHRASSETTTAASSAGRGRPRLTGPRPVRRLLEAPSRSRVRRARRRRAAAQAAPAATKATRRHETHRHRRRPGQPAAALCPRCGRRPRREPRAPTTSACFRQSRPSASGPPLPRAAARRRPERAGFRRRW